jgi:uncharacterized membrane-anchored protein YjiN (DUF445 family)
MKSTKKSRLNPRMKKKLVPQPDKKIQKEVNRILKQNMTSMDLTESHVPFAARFLKNLISEKEVVAPEPTVDDAVSAEATAKSPEDFTQETNEKDFQQSLEPATEPDAFDTEGTPPETTSDTINAIKEWSTKLDEFAGFLNDPSTESLHKILSDGDRAGSLLRGVTRKASDSITRIAGEVEKLKEILNTYIITAPKKLRDTEQQNSGWTQF